MGMNYFLRLKGTYKSAIINDFPYADDNEVYEDNNKYIWHHKEYSSIGELNKEYYFNLHIGKDSAGWVFGLRVFPEHGIKNLEDWVRMFNLPNAQIVNECEEEISVEDMLSIITKKAAYNWENYHSEKEYEDNFVIQWNKEYDEEQAEENRNPRYLNMMARKIKDYDDYLTLPELNGALRGPRGLLRRRGSEFHPIEEVKNSSYDLIIEYANYGW